MALGRALESASVSILLNKIATQQVLDFFLKWKLDTALLSKLKSLLLMIYAVLNHAEERHVEDAAVKLWLDSVKDAAYDAEDLLDDIATDALRSQNSTNQVRNAIYDALNATDSVKEGIDFKLKDISSSLNPFKETLESKLRKLIERLEDIAKQKDILRLREDVIGTVSSVFERLPTTPLVVESIVHGRDKDIEEIIKLLNVGEEFDDQIHVIPIVGMGGVGKTTLAQIVYNNERVQNHFNLKAWACVSDKFDVIRITKALIESLSRQMCRDTNLELLQDNLRRRLSEKRFLLVLDDVWNENYGNWDILRIPFMAGAPGSRVVVTTRNQNVAAIMKTASVYNLQGLTREDCWSLIEQIVFPNRDSNAYPELEMIGQEVANKCNGLPLAAKALGGLLRSKLVKKHWEDIVHSKMWNLPNNDIIPALRLSYYHLPPHLKRCFAYCSIFPKGYVFYIDNLVQLWIAEGFVQSEEETKGIEDVGRAYFSNLVSRSFFQKMNDENEQFVMHDLIHSLALFVSGKACLLLENQKASFKTDYPGTRIRHFSYIRDFSDGFSKFEAISKVNCLRTFLPLNPPPGLTFSDLSSKILDELVPSLNLLRVLSFSGYLIRELPQSLGKLKHLRYLDLSNTELVELPESTGNLYNLQSLLLFHCRYLTKLLADIRGLTNLRHLNTQQTSLAKMPLHIGRLTNLQILTNFVVGKGVGAGIGDFKDLQHLQGALSISELQNVKSVKDAVNAKMKEKQYLDELIFEWGSTFDELRDERIELDVLDMLQPHQNLKKLSVRYYGGTEFPIWMGDPLFCNIVNLQLYGCKKCTALPSLGQLPLLKDLSIEGMDAIQEVGFEFYGDDFSAVDPFPSLERLKFENMKSWEEWFPFEEGDARAFPCLRELLIFRCPKLSKLSHRFPSLEKLCIKRCEELTILSGLPADYNLEVEEFHCLKYLTIVGCSRLKELPTSLPSLLILEIDGCEELHQLPKLEKLQELDFLDSNLGLLGSISDVSSLSTLRVNKISYMLCLPKRLVQHSANLMELKVVACGELVTLSNEQMGLNHLTYLQNLTISQCPNLVALPDEENNLPPALRFLDLRHCHNLVKLPSELYKVSSLEELRIEGCAKLEVLPQMGLPSKLKRLLIHQCKALKTLSDGLLYNNSALEYLEIRGCSSLITILEKGELPATLKQLNIYSCKNLKILPEGLMRQNSLTLEYLDLSECNSLEYFPTGKLPTTLKRPEIHNCTVLKSLPEILHLTRLERLWILGCDLLEYFPRGGLPSISLRAISISRCMNLKSLPERIHNLKSLQELNLQSCPSLNSIPRQGLPPNLKLLSIEDCEKLNPIHEWKLHKLTSLEIFSFGGYPGLVSFSNEYLLPHTITSLTIKRLPNLISISEALQNLEVLDFLRIDDCPMLSSLPKEGLPTTVCSLEIEQCPLLSAQCERERGQYWPKISCIPYLLIA